VARSGELRLSDAEREAAVEHLRQGLAEGRLDLEEFHRRTDLAYAAQRVRDLQPLVGDLPAPARTKGSVRPREERRQRRRRRSITNYLGVNAVVWATWGAFALAEPGHQGLWPLFISLPWGAVLVARQLR